MKFFFSLVIFVWVFEWTHCSNASEHFNASSHGAHPRCVFIWNQTAVKIIHAENPIYVRSGATIAILILRTKLDLIKSGFFHLSLAYIQVVGYLKIFFVDLRSHKIKDPRRALGFIFHVCLSWHLFISSRHRVPSLVWTAFHHKEIVAFDFSLPNMHFSKWIPADVVLFQVKVNTVCWGSARAVTELSFGAPSSQPNVNSLYFSISISIFIFLTSYFLWHIFNDIIKWLYPSGGRFWGCLLSKKEKQKLIFKNYCYSS